MIKAKKDSNDLIKPSPFLKWAGGKKQLLNEIVKRIPKHFDTYIEPFIGGGSVFFFLSPERAIISDLNEELINTYKTIKHSPHKVINELNNFSNTKESFYSIRSVDREESFKSLDKVSKAARTIYLDKTCYNGLFRVNSKGEFNTPFGNYFNPDFVQKDKILAVSRYLNSIELEIECQDFQETLKSAKKGDFVYLDPPYDLIKKDSFISYNKEGFGKEAQIRLKETLDDLDKRGVLFLLSNSATDFIKNLYKNYTIDIVKANRSINSNGKGRDKIDEVLVRNYGI